MSNYLKDRIEALVGPGSTVLDGGCGSHNLLISRDCVGSLIGCDIDAEAVARNPDITDGFITNLEDLRLFEHETFDVVMSVDVLEHLEHPWRFIEGTYRILKPGGYLFCTTPNRRSIHGLVVSRLSTGFLKLLTKLLEGKPTPNDVHHYRMNDLCTIGKWLNATGFIDIEITLLDKLPSGKVRRILLLPDYLLGRLNLFRDFSIGLLCIAQKPFSASVPPCSVGTPSRMKYP